MSTYPRTQDFAAMLATPNIPSNGNFLVLGDHVTADKSANAWGLAERYGAGDVGIGRNSATVSGAAWLAYMPIASTANMIVSARLYWKRLKGTAADVAFGVMGRLSAITDGATGGGAPERWFTASAYTAEVAVTVATQTGVLTIKRVVAGVPTTLATSASFPVTDGRSYNVELRISGTGATVVLNAFVDGALKASFSDTSGSRITATGRFGFRAEFNTNGTQTNQTRTGCRGFTAKDFGTITFVDDDFDRPNRTDADENYIRSLWHASLAVVTTGGSIQYTTPNDSHRLSLYQVRPRSAAYDVKAKITHPNGTSAHWLGLAVHASKSTATAVLTDFTGYLVRLRADSATNNVEVLRYLAGTLSRTWTASATLTTAVAKELRVAVDFDNDEVRVRVFYDGALVLTVRDKDANRVQEAGLAGLYLFRASAGTGTLIIDDWTLDDPAPAGTPTGASVALLGEQYVIAPPASASYAFGKVIAPGGTATLTIPYQAVDNLGVALWATTSRLWPTPSTNPTANDEFKCTPGAGTTALLLNFTPLAGTVFSYEVKLAAGSVALNRKPTGTQNGVNKDFALTVTPTAPEKVRPSVNGYELEYTASDPPGDDGKFTIVSTTTLRLNFGPAAGVRILADAQTSAPGATDPVFQEALAKLSDTQWQAADVPATGAMSTAFRGSHFTPVDVNPGPDQLVLAGSIVVFGTAVPDPDVPRATYLKADFSALTITIKPSLVYEEEERRPAREHEFELYYCARSPLAQKSRRLFHYQWDAVGQGDRDTLVGFLRARKACVEQFTVTPPDEGATVLVHVREFTFQYAKHDVGAFRVAAVLEELFAP